MFDIGSSEIFLILLVAIILINPKDLPSIIKKIKIFLQNFSTIKQEFNKTIGKLEETLEDTFKHADLSKQDFEEFKKEYLEPLEPKKSLELPKIKKITKQDRPQTKDKAVKSKKINSSPKPKLPKEKSN